MYKIPHITIIIIALIISLPVFAQREGEILYEKELVGGINFHTNGGLIGGGMIRYGKRYKENALVHAGLELSFIKDPRELRYLNPTTNNTYIAFKKNAMFVLRPQVGNEWVMFRKAEEDGVQVDFILAGGLSLGFLKPYYIEYLYGAESRFEAYDADVHNDFNRILGSAGALTGLDESKVVPGIHFKPAVSFEMGRFNGNVTGIEIGAMLEYFTDKMVILEPFTGLPPIEGKQFFSSVFLTVYYGFRR